MAEALTNAELYTKRHSIETKLQKNTQRNIMQSIWEPQIMAPKCFALYFLIKDTVISKVA